jgi:hypothetical protein
VTTLTEYLTFATTKRNRKVIEFLVERDECTVETMLHWIVDEWVDYHLERGGPTYAAQFAEKEPA